MSELTEICGLADVSGLGLAELRECLSYSVPFGVDTIEWIVFAAAALLGLGVAALGRRKVSAAVEGLLYTPLAAYGGTVGGLLFAQWMPPWLMGIWLIFVAAAGLFLWITALVKGDASPGWKALGSLELLVLAAAAVAVGVICFTVPEDAAAAGYERYLNAVTWLFAGAAIVDALYVATYGSYHWAVGWLLVPINASWGALGNLMGMLQHALSWSCFKDQGDIARDNRKFYTKYRNGLRLRYTPNKFAFTQAAVMTSPPVETHESQHVLQHFIFGPIFTFSYLLWMVPTALIGLVVGLVKGKGFAGIEAWAYYNNPWEIWAYAVEGHRGQNGDTSLIWGPIASWIVAIAYFLAGVVAFAVLLVLRH